MPFPRRFGDNLCQYYSEQTRQSLVDVWHNIYLYIIGSFA